MARFHAGERAVQTRAGVDAEARDLIDELLRDAAEAGATVVVASHELDRAGGLARRTVLVDSGRVFASPVGEGPVVAEPVTVPAAVSPC